MVDVPTCSVSRTAVGEELTAIVRLPTNEMSAPAWTLRVPLRRPATPVGLTTSRPLPLLTETTGLPDGPRSSCTWSAKTRTVRGAGVPGAERAGTAPTTCSKPKMPDRLWPPMDRDAFVAEVPSCTRTDPAGTVTDPVPSVAVCAAAVVLT